MKKKTAFFAILIISSLTVVSFYNATTINAAQEPFANLVFKTYGGGRWADVALYVAQYLRDIGIDIEIKMLEWSIFIGELVATHDYDLGIVGISGAGDSPDSRSIFTETGSLNLFGLTKEIPYGNLSETMQTDGISITDLEVRQQHYYDWQVLMMDKIVPFLPLYAYRTYISTWSTAVGYDIRWGIYDSLPYMTFTGTHEGQDDITEFNEADLMWVELNTLITDDGPSANIWGLSSEPIIQYNDFAPLKTGFVYDWDQIDDYHYKFYCRDGVYWNPSYNVTERTSSSVPLADVPTGELMVGLKGEYSDGTNQQVTAKDAVFTYAAWANGNTSEDLTYHDWISNCYVDPADDMAFHIEIDANPATPEKEMFVDFWTRLPWNILPEFYLNSTTWDTYKTYTAGGYPNWGLHSDMILTTAWKTFSESCFGNGKFMLDYYVKHSVTVLQKSPYWFGVGAIDGTEGMEIPLETWNVRVIPDRTAELAEFKAGKLDVFSFGGSFDSERKQMQADSRFIVQTTIGAYYDFIFFNLNRPFIGGADNFVWLTEVGKEEYTKGVAVRKAICYAVDREEINQVVGAGEWFVCHSTLRPYTAYYYYDDIEPKYSRDLALAQEWLSAAGYEITLPTPTPFLAIIAAIGAASAIALYRRKRK